MAEEWRTTASGRARSAVAVAAGGHRRVGAHAVAAGAARHRQRLARLLQQLVGALLRLAPPVLPMGQAQARAQAQAKAAAAAKQQAAAQAEEANKDEVAETTSNTSTTPSTYVPAPSSSAALTQVDVDQAVDDASRGAQGGLRLLAQRAIISARLPRMMRWASASETPFSRSRKEQGSARPSPWGQSEPKSTFPAPMRSTSAGMSSSA